MSWLAVMAPTSCLVSAKPIVEHAGHRIGSWEFTKYPLVVAAATVGLAAPYLWLRCP
jgi:Na+/H+ antiporter NhaD/arsenite permease-like protein